MSVVGAGLTIKFSVDAKTAAQAATVAANNARSRILNVDLVFEGAKAVGLADELYELVGLQSWALVTDRANKISEKLLMILAQTPDLLSEETRGNLARANTHIRSVGDTVDGWAKDRSREDTRRLRTLVADQKAIIISVTEILRNTARSEHE